LPPRPRREVGLGEESSCKEYYAALAALLRGGPIDGPPRRSSCKRLVEHISPHFD
jgi:hypothetical protein